MTVHQDHIASRLKHQQRVEVTVDRDGALQVLNVLLDCLAWLEQSRHSVMADTGSLSGSVSGLGLRCMFRRIASSF